MMATMQDIFLFLSLLGSTCALYKQWVPDTNFENATNWDKGSVPCGSDHVVFLAQRKVAVYVETAHTLSEMTLPVDGEFILANGAGFSVREGQDPACGAGVTANFKDFEALRWFDPALWQAASSVDDLHSGPYLFFVHEESVPCKQDDVVFRAVSSFRVDVSANANSVAVKSVSVLGQKFTSNSDFFQYMTSGTGKMQFHGSSAVQVEGSGCSDVTGCECGNSAYHDSICANVKCSELECKKPLHPTGHCCEVCGAIVNIKFTTSFNLDSYRQRLQHLFLTLPAYKSIQMAVSKVPKPQRLLGVITYTTTSEIEVVLLDQNTGSQSGRVAESLARDILKDIAAHGSSLGIESADFQTSSGTSSNVSGMGGGDVAGIVVGVLALLAVLVIIGLLYRRGKIPSLPSLSRWKNNSEIGELGGPIDHGYDNPMFEKPTEMPEIPGLYGGDSLKGITLTHSGVHFVNPAYDETDFDA